MKRMLISGTMIFCLISGCKKDSTPPPPPPTAEELLTSATWKIDDERWMQINSSGVGASYYYKRGVTGNIANLDNESITFATNNTGTYRLGASTYPLTWQFTNAEKTKMQVTISQSPTLTVNWENVTLTASSLKYAEYYTHPSGLVSLASASRIH